MMNITIEVIEEVRKNLERKFNGVQFIKVKGSQLYFEYTEGEDYVTVIVDTEIAEVVEDILTFETARYYVGQYDDNDFIVEKATAVYYFESFKNIDENYEEIKNYKRQNSAIKKAYEMAKNEGVAFNGLQMMF